MNNSKPHQLVKHMNLCMITGAQQPRVILNNFPIHTECVILLSSRTKPRTQGGAVLCVSVCVHIGHASQTTRGHCVFNNAPRKLP